MSLAPGARLGAYEIIALIGAGGMTRVAFVMKNGVIYRKP